MIRIIKTWIIPDAYWNGMSGRHFSYSNPNIRGAEIIKSVKREEPQEVRLEGTLGYREDYPERQIGIRLRDGKFYYVGESTIKSFSEEEKQTWVAEGVFRKS